MCSPKIQLFILITFYISAKDCFMKTQTLKCKNCTTILVLIIQMLFSFNLFAQIKYEYGGVVRGDSLEKSLSLVFTGHEFAEGGDEILNTLGRFDVKASFFLTGDFYRNPDFETLIHKIKNEGHYLGAHSDKHLLYCSWEDRNLLLVDREAFENDLRDNYFQMKRFGLSWEDAPYFLPPYEWYNDSISQWSNNMGLKLVNFTRGTKSQADYTDPSMGNYVSSKEIFESIQVYEANSPSGLNGFMLLTHIGVGDKRKDKFYKMLPDLLHWLKKNGYSVVPLEVLFGEGKVFYPKLSKLF